MKSPPLAPRPAERRSFLWGGAAFTVGSERAPAPSFPASAGWTYRSGAAAGATLLSPLTPPPPSRSRALAFFVLGEVTPSWSSFTRNCFLSQSPAGFLPAGTVAMATTEEPAEDDESRLPAATGRPAPELRKVE